MQHHLTMTVPRRRQNSFLQKYRVIQDRLYMSDFDRYLLELEENMKK